MTLDCSLQLDVYHPASLTGEYSEDTIDWSVSTDPDHAFPYLLAPRQYAEQEIDTIACTASIGQIEIGVMDIPTTPGDQNTGWMTARVHDVLGRRCRLSRYVNADIGWILISDGPAGAPKMDSSYSAYRWTIRDTRDTERKIVAFAAGSVASIVPRGSIYDWGAYDDTEGSHYLLPGALSNPVAGIMSAAVFSGVVYGVINLASHLSGSGDTLVVNDPRLVVDDDAFDAMATSQVGVNAFLARNADLLWRKVGDIAWNVARPSGFVAFPQPFVGYVDARLDILDADPVRVLNYVTLYAEASDTAPAGFPLDGDAVEFVIRYRGPASDAFPYYVEGELGAVIKNLYDGVYSSPNSTGIAGSVYDPAGFDSGSPSSVALIRYDATALATMIEHVLLRQTEPVDDGRAFAEAQLYAPSGWIPALDDDGRISPVNRGRPDTIDSGLTITNAHVVPTTAWNTGTKIVSAVEFSWSRYFIPDDASGFTVAGDGLAIRPIDLTYEDEESKLRYGDNVQTYDASAFSAVGDALGLNLPGVTEQADLLSQFARFDVLDRFRAGVQAIAVQVRRSQLPLVRVGDWIPWNLSWFPDRATGLRGSVIDAAQIVSIRDDNCTWRTMTLEESSAEGAVGGEPGYVDSLTVLSDDYDPGYVDLLTELSDVDEPLS